jgi:hypothetical protein
MALSELKIRGGRKPERVRAMTDSGEPEHGLVSDRVLRFARIQEVVYAQSEDYDDSVQLTHLPDEHLLSAKLVRPLVIRLEFADGKKWDLRISRLGLPLSRINWETIAVSPEGHSITFTAIKGELIQVLGSKLRYLVDTDYAKKVDSEVDRLRGMLDEFGEGERPAGLWDKPEKDPVPPSFK